MIKKAVLPLLTAPFLMVFSDFSFASSYYYRTTHVGSSPSGACSARASGLGGGEVLSVGSSCSIRWPHGGYNNYGITRVEGCHATVGCVDQETADLMQADPYVTPKMTDEECAASNGDTFSTHNVGTYNYLSTGGTVRTHSGACSVTGGGAGVDGCSIGDDGANCIATIESSSTGEYGYFGNHITGGLDTSSDGTFSVVDFETPEYLNELPGDCTDNSSCVVIGDKSYLVDWDSAPDYFSYVDSNGTTHSNPSSGGGSGGDNGGGDTGGGDPTDPTDLTDPTDPGGDTGGGDTGGGDDSGNDDSDDSNGGGGSGGGSTVPDFEFDESGIIEAIGSAGRSNRNAINALSNDVTGAISDQTNDLNTATTAQTDALNSTLNNQTDNLTSSLDDQTNDLTTAIDDQTGTLTGSLDALGTSIVDAINGLGADEGEGDGDGEGDQEGFFEGLVDSLADRFDSKIDGALNPDGMPGDSETAGMIDGEGVANEIMQSLEQEAEQQNGAIYDEFEGIFEGGGIIDGALAPLRDFVTSFLPSLPTGGCTPLTFGAGQRSFTIDCEGFNLLKAALSWVLFFFTAYQLISIPLDARKAQQ